MTERHLHHWTVHHIMDDDEQIVSLKLPFHKVVAGHFSLLMSLLLHLQETTRVFCISFYSDYILVTF